MEKIIFFVKFKKKINNETNCKKEKKEIPLMSSSSHAHVTCHMSHVCVCAHLGLLKTNGEKVPAQHSSHPMDC